MATGDRWWAVSCFAAFFVAIALIWAVAGFEAECTRRGGVMGRTVFWVDCFVPARREDHE